MASGFFLFDLGFCLFGLSLGFLFIWWLLFFPSIDLFQPNLGEVGLILLFNVDCIYVLMIPEPWWGEDKLRALIKVKL